MIDQIQVIKDALAEVDRQAKEERATLAAVRMYVATAVIELKSMKRQHQYAAHAGRAIKGLQELLRMKSAVAPLKLVKP